VEIIFGRKIRSTTKGVFRTAIDRHDNKGVVVNVFYKHSRIKQYLKDGRAMRTETVINAPRDLAATPDCPTSTNSRPKPCMQPPHPGCSSVSARAVCLPVQPLSGSRTPPWIRRGGGHCCVGREQVRAATLPA
jgi:hypothetical protein